MYIAIAVIQQAASVMLRYLGEAVVWGAANALRYDLARHCLGLDMGFHNHHSLGELIERIDGDIQAFSNFFSQIVVLIIGNLLLVPGILCVLFFEN